MSKDMADKRNGAVESQSVTATTGNPQVAGATAEALGLSAVGSRIEYGVYEKIHYARFNSSLYG